MVINLVCKITNFFLSKKVTDPLSGFFIITNQKFGELQEKLYKDGFKIGKDRGIRIMPFFEERIGGTEGFYFAYLQLKGKNN